MLPTLPNWVAERRWQDVSKFGSLDVQDIACKKSPYARTGRRPMANPGAQDVDSNLDKPSLLKECPDAPRIVGQESIPDDVES